MNFQFTAHIWSNLNINQHIMGDVAGSFRSVQNVEHKCLLICGYKLNCGLHRCQEPCHRGNCEPCWQSSESMKTFHFNFSSLVFSFVALCSSHVPGDSLILVFAGFDELTCHCGLTILYPPIACGTKPPECKNMCTRRHECDHPGEIKRWMSTSLFKTAIGSV